MTIEERKIFTIIEKIFILQRNQC